MLETGTSFWPRKCVEVNIILRIYEAKVFITFTEVRWISDSETVREE